MNIFRRISAGTTTHSDTGIVIGLIIIALLAGLIVGGFILI